MKKETKKKIFNSILGATITTLAVTPIAIVLGQNAKNNLFSETSTFSSVSETVKNDGYQLSNDGYAILPNTIKSSHENGTAASIPNGYVLVSNDNKIICVNNNFLTANLWEYSIPSGFSVSHINYMPINDSIVFLLGNESNGTQNIKVGRIANVSSLSGGASVNAEITDVKSFSPISPFEKYKLFEKYNTFGMVPVFFDNSASNELMIFPRTAKGLTNNYKQWYVYNCVENTIKEMPLLNWNIATSETAGILSANVFKKTSTGNYTITTMNARSNDPTPSGKTWVVLEVLSVDSQNNSSKSVIKKDLTNYGRLWNYTDISFALSTLLTNGLGSTIWYSGSLGTYQQLVISFANSRHRANNDAPVQRGGFLAKIVLHNPGTNEVTLNGTSNIAAFASSISGNNPGELWGSFYDNAAILKNGATITTQAEVSGKFYGLGYLPTSTIGGNSGFFAFVLENPTGGLQYFTTSSTNNSTTSRTYVFSSTSGANVSDVPQYRLPGLWEANTTISSDVALLLPKYDDTINSLASRTYDQNIFVTANNSNKSIIINQKDRGTKTNEGASYGWYTHSAIQTSSGVVEISARPEDAEKPVNEVTIDYIRDYYPMENDATLSWDQVQFLKQIKMQNVMEGTIFRLNPSSLYINPDGYVTIDLYFTKGFTKYVNEGSYNYPWGGYVITTSLSNLESKWWPPHKVLSIKISGFKSISVTEVSSIPYELTAVTTSGISSRTLIPLIIKDASSSTSYKAFKEIVWRSICSNGGATGQPLLLNLLKQPTFNESTWESDWSKFFASFSISGLSGDNNEIILVNFSIKPEYAFPWPGATATFENVQLTGFRKSGLATKFNNNNEATAFSVEGTSLASKNIPYTGSSYTIPSYVNQSATVATELEIKDFLYENYIKTAYDNATFENSYFVKNDWVSTVTYKTRLVNQSTKTSEQLKGYELTRDNLYLSDWKFYPAKGMLAVNVRLNVWFDSSKSTNGNNGLRWANGVYIDGIGGTESVTEAPFGTWYIKGFRSDNVTTSFNTDEYVDLSGVTWNSYNISNLLASNALQDSSVRTVVRKAILERYISSGNLKLPYWVNPNSLINLESGYGELNLLNMVSSNNAEGQAILTVHLKRNNWVAQPDGSVVNNGYDLAPTTWNIKLSGFKKVSSVKVDSSMFFEISGNLLDKQIFFTPSTSNNSFKEWITNTQTKIVRYVYEKDVEINGTSSRTEEQWKSSLQFKFYFNNNLNPEQSFTLNLLDNQITTLVNSSTGKLNYFFNSITQDGIKMWIEIIDTKSSQFDSTIEGSPTNSETGKGLIGLLDTSKVSMNIDMNDWINNLAKIKGTSVEGNDEISSTIKSILPPEYQGTNAGQGMSFTSVVNLLSKIGYKFEYSWIDARGSKQTSTNLPTNFSYNPTNPVIDLRIYYSKTLREPNIYIFGDPEFAKYETTVSLSLNVKKVISVDLSIFAEMANSGRFSATSENITITPSGEYSDVTQNANIVSSWTSFEDYVFEVLANSDVSLKEEYKNILKISYSVNNTNSFDYTAKTLWTGVVDGWQSAIANTNDIAKLRFYSQKISKGTTIRATIQFKNSSYDDSYSIRFTDNVSSQIVNHGLGTTFDMSKFAEKWQSTKTTATQGSTAESLLGFTPPTTPNGTSFDEFMRIASTELGMLFQFSSDNKTWYDEKSQITKVNKNDPAIYMRLSSTTSDNVLWSNEFEIMNFATGVTDSTSNDPNLKYSSGVKLPLNLPKYLQIENSWITEFIENSKSSWSGNTKNIKINHSVMQSAIDTLKTKIITENGVSSSLSNSDLKVEFKIDASSASSDSGSTFAEYTQSLASNIANGNYWEQFANGIFVRVVLSTPDSTDVNYDDIKTSYNGVDQEFALTVTPHVYFIDNASSNQYNEDINPIKIWKNSVENKLPTIKVEGKSNKDISFIYPTDFVYDANLRKLYTDSSKRLIVQFSINNVTSYNDPNAEWTDIPPTEISIQKWLFVRVVPNYDNVVYGPAEDSTAQAHQLDTTNIKPVIEADINALRELVLTGTILIGGTNQNTFNLDELKALEQQTLINVIQDELSRNSVEIVYSLRTSATDKNTDWLTLEQLIAKLSERNWYNQSNFGIISFENDKYSLQATIRSTDPNYNVIDSITGTSEKVAEGVTLNTTKIVTQIDLSQWIETITTNKASIVNKVRKSSRTIVDIGAQGKMIQPVSMPGELGESFLSGRSYSEIYTTLIKFGISFQFSSDNKTWPASTIEELTWFDDTTNKIYMRIIGPQSSGNQVKVVVDGSEIQIKSFTIPIQYPKSLVVEEEWINEFISAKPVSGNTKFIKIDEELENALVQKIVDANPPVLGDPTPTVWVEYSLGTSGWLKRDEFIQKLAEKTTDQTTNEVKFRLAVDPVNAKEPVYAIDQTEYVLSEDNVGSELSEIKVYVNKNYETEADSISISGSNEIFTYNYGQLPVNSNDGTWKGSKGLKIQWTTDSSATYSDAQDDPKWKDAQISEIDPTERYLAIRIIALPGYIYSANYNENGVIANADIHVVDTTNIKSMIKVDLNDLYNKLVFNGYSSGLNLDELKASETSILDNIQGGDKLGIRYKVTLNNGSQLSTEWMTADELQTALLNYSNDYANSTSGLIKFTSDGIDGATIEATFVSIDDKYIPVDPSNNIDNGITINTENIKTKIDLSKYFEVLKTVKTELAEGSTSSDIKGITPPSMTGSKGDSLFAGFTYEEIKQVLASMGVKIEFQAPGSSTGDQWLPAENIKDLDDTNRLYIRFVPTNENLNDNIEIWGTQGPQDNTSPESVLLKIMLPMVIKTNVEDLAQISFEGTTNNLTNLEAIKQLEQQIITTTKDNNKIGDPTIDEKIDAAEIVILYSLNELQLAEPTESSDGVWFTADEIANIFASSNVNYGTNRVLAKFVIINNPPLDDGVTPTYQLSSSESKVINEEQFTDEAPFKVYIHNVEATTPDWIIENLKVTGTVENYTISNLESWIESLPKGLTIQYNVTNLDPDNPTPDDLAWFDVFDPANNILSSDKNIWIRFVVEPGFVFENALVDTNVSAPIKLDATAIKVNIKLKSEWLSSIQLSGNTKHLEIDETITRQFIDEQGGLPTTLDRAIIKIEYSYDEVNWYEKDAFKAKLIEQDGAIDETNWIILRENIKARFVINREINDQQNPPYGLEVDGLIIEEGKEENSPQIQLITDTNNTTVKGYINANKLTPFIASNFEVNGTNTNGTLTIKDVATFNKLLNPYASSGILQILYSEDEKAGFLPDQIVWDPAYGMREKLKIAGEHSDLYFAVALQSASSDYEVYHDNVLQTPNGYVLSSPDIKVYISTEIENPLIGKVIESLFLDDQNQPIWYQNEGAFYVKIKTDEGEFTFEEFLNSISEGTGEGQLTANAKEAIELVYYVSDHELSQEEYAEATSESKITDYEAAKTATNKYGVWRSLESSADLASLNFNLMVNDYIIVALRVKEEKISSETNKQGFVIKDGNYTPTNSTRVFGYKVHADQVNVNWSSLKLKNVDKAESAEYGLDGYAMLSSLSLAQDINNNYQGVSLELKFFNEFYRNDSGNILVSASGDRLVKRDTTGLTSNTPYYDTNGTPIKDSTGQIVYNYLTSDGIPPAPITESTSTRSIVLAEQSSNNFTLVNTDISKNADYSFFANQYIEIEFKNKKGLSPENEDIYDYYVDQQISRSYTINKDGEKLIKFPITNDKRITYTFNSNEFINFISKDSNIADGLVYDNAVNGEAKLIHSYEITRTAIGENVKVLTTFNEIVEQIKSDFNGQVGLKVTYIKKSTGETTTLDEVELSSFSNLSNGDIFKVEIVSTNDELIYGEQPDPLVFEISGLKVKSFDQSLLQFLRVEQSGEWNGQGQFRVYIDNPNDTSDDGKTIKELLNNEGEFLVRVWDNNREIKHNWTSDFDSIQNLENGDKVEWRLVRNNERPEQEYYNTIASSHTQNGYEFIVVQFDGNYSVSIVSNGIGEWNGQDEYPENSGFIINNLKVSENVDFPGITFDEFERLIKLLDFKYDGINGYGNMISSKNVSDVIVNTKELISPAARTQYSLEYLINNGYIKFYSSNSEGKSGSLDYKEFNWVQVMGDSGQLINSPGNLWNGQWIKVTYQDDSMSQPWVITGDTLSSLIVNGLKIAPSEGEPISMITWVLLSVVGVATLGIFFFIYFFARNRKLK